MPNMHDSLPQAHGTAPRLLFSIFVYYQECYSVLSSSPAPRNRAEFFFCC